MSDEPPSGCAGVVAGGTNGGVLAVVGVAGVGAGVVVVAVVGVVWVEFAVDVLGLSSRRPPPWRSPSCLLEWSSSAPAVARGTNGGVFAVVGVDGCDGTAGAGVPLP